MSIKLYVGRMGSGKSYEVVSVVILQALKIGRRVVSNIAGLNYDKFVDLLTEQGVKEEQIGELVCVSHEDVVKEYFFLTDEKKDDEDCFLKPGDLLCLDEIWRFWKGFESKEMPESVMNFFRMHRHFVNEKTGLCCDVALITQDAMDLSRKVRGVVEETYKMTKLTVIGAAKKYRVDIYTGANVRLKPVSTFYRSYDKKYFPLYSTHSKKTGDVDGKEINIDDRGNIFKNKFFLIFIPTALLVLLFSIWNLIKFFDGSKNEKKDKNIVELENKKENQKKSENSRGKNLENNKLVSNIYAENNVKYKVLGFYRNGKNVVGVVSDGITSRYLNSPPVLKKEGLTIQILMPDGSFATSYKSFDDVRVNKNFLSDSILKNRQQNYSSNNRSNKGE